MARLGKKIDDTLKRLIRVSGMQSRKTQMPRIRKGNSRFHGVAVTNFANENHVWRLTHGAFERGLERMGVEPYLALINDRAFVSVDEFDWVFHRDDVSRRMTISMV